MAIIITDELMILTSRELFYSVTQARVSVSDSLGGAV